MQLWYLSTKILQFGSRLLMVSEELLHLYNLSLYGRGCSCRLNKIDGMRGTTVHDKLLSSPFFQYLPNTNHLALAVRHKADDLASIILLSKFD